MCPARNTFIIYQLNIWGNTNTKTITYGKSKFNRTSLHIVKIKFKNCVKTKSDNNKREIFKLNRRHREGYLNRLSEIESRDIRGSVCVMMKPRQIV